MKKSILISSIILIGFCTTAIAQDKVVVIPLNSSKVAGTDGQVQYNDNGVSAGAEVYYDKATGKVGIGTSAPGSNLSIVTETPGGIDITHYGVTGSGIRVNRALGTKAAPEALSGQYITNLSGAGYDGTEFIHAAYMAIVNDGPVTTGIVPGSFRFGTRDVTGGWKERVVIKNDGKMGIGTISPSQLLEVYDATSHSQILMRTGVDNQTAGIVMEGPSQRWRIFKTTDNYNMQFYDATGNTVAMEIERNTGNVGIGTRTPQGKLDVNGSIFQRGVSLHADYVFDSKYELETIEEHSKFMWKEKHLQSVPKKQVDKNGLEIIEIGSHRKGMLEELEKAHIYIDQLNTKITKQNSEIASMKSLLCKEYKDEPVCNE